MSKIGFCFSGEGARGAVQAGIALSLSQKGINPDVTLGSSSGAICSAGYAYLNPTGLVNLWTGINSIWNVFGFNWNFLWNTGILNQNPSEKYVANILNNTPICESIVSHLNIATGNVEYVSNKYIDTADFVEAVLSAFAIPGLVTARNGYVDGAFMVETPLQQAIDIGCTEIHVILGCPMAPSPSPLPSGFFSFAMMFYRAFDLTLTELLIMDVCNYIKSGNSIPIHVYQPKTCLYSLLDFSQCAAGVTYGMENYTEFQEIGFDKSILM